jgi:hypothetical protein
MSEYCEQGYHECCDFDYVDSECDCGCHDEARMIRDSKAEEANDCGCGFGELCPKNLLADSASADSQLTNGTAKTEESAGGEG